MSSFFKALGTKAALTSAPYRKGQWTRALDLIVVTAIFSLFG